MKYAFTPHLSLASLDSYRSPSLDDELTAPSPEPLDSPRTPITRRGSGDIVIKGMSSQRNSQASYGFGAGAMASGELLQEKLSQKETQKHSRQRTASSAANLFVPSKAENRKSDTIDPTLQTVADRISLTSNSESITPAPKSASDLSATSADCGPSCAHFTHRDSAGYNRQSVGYGAGAGTRCSVSEDVLAAWGSLGGWRDVQV